MVTQNMGDRKLVTQNFVYEDLSRDEEIMSDVRSLLRYHGSGSRMQKRTCECHRAPFSVLVSPLVPIAVPVNFPNSDILMLVFV